MSTYIMSTNRYVGAAKIVPDSRRPRRLASMISTTAAIVIGTVYGSQSGHHRRQRRHARRDRHRDGQHVVDQQRARRGQPRQHAQVVAGHDVAAAT